MYLMHGSLTFVFDFIEIQTLEMMRFVVITALLACYFGSCIAATSECNQDLYSTAVVENGTLIAKGETAEYNGVRIRPILCRYNSISQTTQQQILH